MKYDIILAGNPNVGKSTIFNTLTGLKQHTGNWSGKTVELAFGTCRGENGVYKVADLPGTYSLITHSREEEIARDYIKENSENGVVVVICDASCLERNLNLALQILEIAPRVVLCVNFMDEANKKGVKINGLKLSELLGVPVVMTTARKKKSLNALLFAIESEFSRIVTKPREKLNMLEGCENYCNPAITSFVGMEASSIPTFADDATASFFVLNAEKISALCVEIEKDFKRSGKIERFLTGKATGIPVMILFLILIFWLTITGANYPSELLAKGFALLRAPLDNLCAFMPAWLSGMLLDGVYNVLTWVAAVMLPPMAIFFPLFTFLEDWGYLPRIAFNLDKFFKKANACGKQALTMCMGFGCNACAIIGARIIDSPRERLIAILTNVFVPCNGRFPFLLIIISLFFTGAAGGLAGTVLSALYLTAIIVLGVAATFVVSRILSRTILKGLPSSFTLELPPFRRPQFMKVLVRSLLDRTLFVLGRAVIIAAPAGLVIWILANTNTGADGHTLLYVISNALEPVGRALGMDGVIILAFILAFPANEIVLPIIIMCYLGAGTLAEPSEAAHIKDLLVQNGWTLTTAVSVTLFSLMHFPCSTTCLTIFKETKSVKWTTAAFLIPTVTGMFICGVFNLIAVLLF